VKLKCPHCGHGADLIEFANEEAARQAVYLAADLPKPLGRIIMRYTGLFRPASRSLSWNRILKLLKQLKADIDAGRIERHGRIWSAPEPAWHNAINVVLEQAEQTKLKLPLKNHGYLYEIISANQNSVETHAEQKIEEQRRHKQPNTTSSRPKHVIDPLAKEVGSKTLEILKSNRNLRIKGIKK